MGATVRQVLVENHQKNIDSLEEYLASGKAKDFSDYQYVCGQIRGLRFAISNTTDLLRDMEEDDD